MMKKNPAELSVEERLQTLYELQTVLSAIDEKKALRGELPLEVRDLEDEIEGLNTRLDRISFEIKDFQRAMQQKKNDILAAQASVERYNAQIDEVKSNREYDMLSKEIEYQKLEIELCEKKIKEAEDIVQRDMEEEQRTRQLIAECEEALKEKREELDDIMNETRTEERELNAKVAELEECIEPRLLASFKRIRSGARNGLGIVYVQRDACGGCFNKIPPQRQLDIKMHKKIIVCEYCGRILIDPEMAGVKPSEDVEEKKTARKRGIGRRKKAETEEEA